AASRGQNLAQMALAWVLAQKGVTSVIIGARTVNQLSDSIACLRNQEFSSDELASI
ncbi:MAG: aldo/keto reductase, partial [Muribaculaceae bacterium]|nr:aldo/keto reductase [Muribaculaceae bacterium]